MNKGIRLIFRFVFDTTEKKDLSSSQILCSPQKSFLKFRLKTSISMGWLLLFGWREDGKNEQNSKSSRNILCAF